MPRGDRGLQRSLVHGFFKRPAGHFQVGVSVDCAGFDIGVAKDGLDDYDVVTRLEQVHGFAMAERVRGNSLRQAGSMLPCRLGVLAQDVADPRAREPFTPPVPKERMIESFRMIEAMFSNIAPQQVRGFLH